MAHLDAAHNLARWLTRSHPDAEDVVQESCMKALRSFDTFRGGDFRAWFLAIVRNTCFTLISRRKSGGGRAAAQNIDDAPEMPADIETYDPQEIATRAADAKLVRCAIDSLPELWREVVVLREMEGMSYKEIGKIVGIPIGTVMSRLARARAELQSQLMHLDPEGSP